MPRQKNTLPTNIYWLFDMRPETLLVFGSAGRPFYCGKTVRTIEFRLCNHKCASKQHASTTHEMIVNCGEHIRTQLMEIVPLTVNWADRERAWIAELRLVNPNATNRASGGAGAAGAIWSDEARANKSKARTGHRHSTATKVKLSVLGKGRKLSQAHRNAISAAQRGREKSPETCAKISLAKQGGTISQAHRVAISAAQRGKKLSPETRAKISATRFARGLNKS